MELFRLQYFLELCKWKQFTKAAEQLQISQAALSKQIKLLEETLGVTLFKRNGQATSLTPAGLLLEKYCWRITNELVALDEELTELTTAKQHVCLATHLCDLEYKLNDLLLATLADYPLNVQFHWHITEDIVACLENLEAAFAIASTNIEAPAHITKINLFTADYQLIVRKKHPCLKAENPLTVLMNYPMIRLNKEAAEQRRLMNWLQRYNCGLQPENITQVDTVALITQLVAQSDSFAIVPDYTSFGFHQNQLTNLTGVNLPQKQLALYFLKDRHISKTLRQLFSTCKQQLSNEEELAPH